MEKTGRAIAALAALVIGASSATAHHASGASGQKSAAPRTAPKSPKDRMPGPIRAAFEAAYPTAIVKNVSSEKENGAVVWEVESTDNGKTRDIIYKPDGTVVLVEDGLDEADLPAPVKQAVAATYPKGKIVRPERATQGSTVFYEMIVEVGGKKHVVELDPDGKPHVEKKEAKEAPAKKKS